MTPFSFQAFARSQRCVTFSSQSFLITITGLITDDSSSANRNIDLTMYRFTRIQTSWFLIFSTRQGRSFEKIKLFNKAGARGDKVEKPQETKHE